MIKVPSQFQLAIFKAFQETDCNIAINAVAGSGKTSTIEHLAGLINPLDYMDTLFCAFNKAIKEELAKRLPNRINVATFHSVGKAIVEDGYSVRTHGKWVNSFKYKEICDNLLFGAGYDMTEDFDYFDTLKKVVGYCQVSLTDPDDSEAFNSLLDYWELPYLPNMAVLASKALTKGLAMARNGECIDFNDMIWIPATQDIKRRKYAYIFVDECQDFNAAQLALIDSLRRPNNETKVVAVGDPRQAIYGFAGADTSSFDNVVKTFNAVVMPLSVSYRCGKNIVAEAQLIVPEILPNDASQDGEVNHISYEQMVKSLNPMAEDMVICRVNAPLLSLAFECLEKEIPCKIKGRDFLNGLISMARTILKKDSQRWTDFLDHLDTYAEKERERFKKDKNSGDMKISNLDDKVGALTILYTRAIQAGISSFDTFTKWIEDIYTDYDAKGCVMLSSVHKAKGLEANNVFILEPGLMPHPMAETPEQIAQEYNLKYVAITRAKNRLSYVGPKKNK